MFKLQNITIIFSIIILPITLIMSYYIQIQIDTLALQTQYDTKLIDATYDAMTAIQLNMLNNDYSTNADSLRGDVEASVETFMNTLAINLGVSGYSSTYIKPYIPAMVYTLYDGYYIYAPYKTEEDKSAYGLKSYVYYSARYKKGNIDVTINYSLDNYVSVYGYIDSTTYIARSGYIVPTTNSSSNSATGVYVSGNTVKYNGVEITNDDDAINYYKEAYKFSKEVIYELRNLTASNIVAIDGDEVVTASELSDSSNAYYIFKDKTDIKIFDISSNNNPEEAISDFQQHKMEVIKISIQSNLNAAISSYSNRSTYNYKMPLLSDADWEKLLSNVSVVAFMQGLPVGTKMYNNYAIVTSTGNELYVSQDELYFTTDVDNYYHKINCEIIKSASSIKGYKTISFKRVWNSEKEIDLDGDGVADQIGGYAYKHNEYACYNCVVHDKTSWLINRNIRFIEFITNK